MHLKRSLGLAALLLATAAVLVGTAGAVRAPQQHQRQIHFTSVKGVLKYLKAHGISTRGIVIQRSLHNYAGPKCPGKRWSCTNARRVIQFASSADSSNTFVCSPASAQVPPTSSPNDCTIVQTNTTGDNNAKCIEQSSAPSATQNCSITQTNAFGANNAAVVQLLNQGGQSSDGQQNAHVKQTNGTGKNNSALTQTIVQSATTSGPTVNQSQDGRQVNDINQTSGTGDQVSVMSQVVTQREVAGKSDRDRDRDSDFSTFAATPFTGAQSQFGDGQSDTDQSSTGVSKSFNFQNMFQSEVAPKFSAVTQDQNGPFRCCSQQGTNSSDVFNIQQSKIQLASSAARNQFLDESGFLDTTGHGHISQFGNQNGSTQSNSCDVNAGACAAETIAEDGTFDTCTESGGEPSCFLCPPITGCSDFQTASASATAASKALRGRRAQRPRHAR
jgi:hypothetical protein